MKQFRFSLDHIGRPMEELVDNIRFSTIIENIHEVINSGEVLEKEIQTSDFRWFQMNIIPYVVKKDNRTNGVIITFVDITDRIKDLRDLERLNASRETFIYSVSHDLKAPLANIEALVHDLVEECACDTEESKKIEGMLYTSLKVMTDVITEISEITKIEGKFQETIEKVSFDTILNEVKLTINDKIDESKAHIYSEIKEPEIEFSRKNLRSILYNLLSNAIKYKSPSRVPEILIKTENENGYVIISVKDNGRGITEEQKEILFTQYSRLEKVEEGTGIGLYLVKKIVENEGGKIILNSKIGEGSEFKVYLKTKS
jgi:two-component system, OmpR family, phosphate regulon sensor histidine kinase PhoR